MPARWPDRWRRDWGSHHRRAARWGGRRCGPRSVRAWGGLALVGAAVGDADADDGARGVRGGGELDVEGRAEATVGIFLTRASGSVVDTRGVASLAPLFFLIAATSGSSASACSSRASRSCATRAIVAAWRAVRAGRSPRG